MKAMQADTERPIHDLNVDFWLSMAHKVRAFWSDRRQKIIVNRFVFLQMKCVHSWCRVDFFPDVPIIGWPFVCPCHWIYALVMQVYFSVSVQCIQSVFFVNNFAEVLDVVVDSKSEKMDTNSQNSGIGPVACCREGWLDPPNAITQNSLLTSHLPHSQLLLP